MENDEETKHLIENYEKSIESLNLWKKKRASVLNRIFWELNNINIDEFEDLDSKFIKLIPEKRVYPNTFLASSLGFSKSSLDSRHTSILHKFNLENKPKVASLKNSLHFERLKLLMNKYLDKNKK